MRSVVLNTRSSHQAGEFTEKLLAAGFESLEIPALDIEKLNSEAELVSALRLLGSKDVVAFSSANAALIACQNLEAKTEIEKKKVAAIGDKTASILKENGISVHLQSKEANSEELADIILNVEPTKVLYASGIPNTGILKEKLNGKTSFTEIPVYASKPSASLKNNLLTREDELQMVSHLVFLSKEALLAFEEAAKSLTEDLKDRTCGVISPRVAEAAEKLGYKKIKISQARSIDAIVEALLSSSSAIG